VKPNSAYTRDPFLPEIEDGKLFGLGSNDAGASLVCLLGAFMHFYDQPNLAYNLVWAGTAEEEISGPNGIASIWAELPAVQFALVGEPTLMHMAIAEKGLMVLDCEAIGKPGHAARDEGINAIYEAIDDIQWFRLYQFPKISPLLGAVKMTVTQVEAGREHNVVPGICKFTVDVRLTEMYSPEEVLATICSHVKCHVKVRSMRLLPSAIAPEHPMVQAGLSLGRKTFGSPTLSDQALMPVPSMKMGPGDSARSHTANEFIFLSEIEEGLDLYVKILEKLLISP
jgi:acetylornithine deacetylase